MHRGLGVSEMDGCAGRRGNAGVVARVVLVTLCVLLGALVSVGSARASDVLVSGRGLSGPQKLAVDSSGDLFIADTYNGRVVVDKPNRSGGYTQSTVDSGLSYPQGVAVDASGNVFIADTNNGRVVVDKPDGSGGYTQSTVDGGLYYPQGVAVDGSGNVLIADTYNGRVVLDKPDGSGGYTQSTVDTGLYYPQGVAVDASGNVIIADTYNNRVVVDKPNGGGYTQSTVDTDLSNPRAVAVDASGNVFIADTYSGRVVVDKPDGSGGYTQSTVDSGLSYPQGIAVDASGSVFIADTGNNRLLVDTPDGSDGYTQSTVDDGGVSNPSGVAVDASGNVFIADTNHSRLVVDKPNGSGGYTQSTVDTDLAGPQGVAVDASGNLFIADTYNNRVVVDKPNSSGGYTQSLVRSHLSGPRGVAVDGSGNVFIADTNNNRVVVDKPNSSGGYTQSLVRSGLGYPSGVAVDASGNVIIADDNHSRVVVDKPNGRGGYTQSTIASGLSYPQGVAADASGNVFIADTYNNRVVVDQPDGSGGYTQSTVDSGLSYPQGVAVDASGNVFIADTGNNRVVMHPVPAPVNTAAPSISGTAQDGQTLTETNGSWSGSPTGFTYQWQRCDSAGNNCSDISGATDSTYTPNSDDVGHTIVVQETASNGGGSGDPAMSSPTGVVAAQPPPANVSPPTISGTAQDGQTLTEVNGSWSGSPTGFTYQWQRCDSAGNNCSDISGATDSTYTPNSDDVGHTIVVKETASNDAGSGDPATSSPTSVVLPQAPANLSPPTVSGTAQDGQTLTETNGSWSGSPTGFTYQWEDCDSSGANCTPISGATDQSYTPNSSDVGYTIVVKETASNGGGGGSPATSSPTSVVLPLPPANLSQPTISGTAQDGQTLTEVNGSWSGNPTGFTYQWEDCDSSGANCTPISGATQQTYGVKSTDVGYTIVVQEFASNDAGTGDPASSAQTAAVLLPSAPSNSGLPTISGTAQDGQVLTRTSVGTWSSPDRLTYTYQWQRCANDGTGCSNISGATNSGYRLTSADVGHQITVMVTATDQEGQSTPATATPIGPVTPPLAPSNSTSPSVPGTLTDGVAVQAQPGSWSSPDRLTYSYQWQRCAADGSGCTNIDGQTTRWYKPTAADVGHKLTVVVTATDQESQSTPATATPIGPVTPPLAPSNSTSPSVPGTLTDGVAVQAQPGSWSSPDRLTYSYQWQRCAADGSGCANITGQTTRWYKPTPTDVGHQLTVVVIATDQESQTGTATATPTGPVSNPPAPQNTTLLPSMTGTLADGQFVQAQPGSWSSPDRLTYSYQWQRCAADGSGCANITGQTTRWYKPTPTDVGHKLTVVVTATDQESQSTPATATPTGPVSNPSAPQNTTLPSLPGTLTDGVAVQAQPGSWSSPDRLTYSYQWQRCAADGSACTNIDGQTSRWYKPTPTDVGHKLTVVVTATDQENQTGTATATPTGPVR